jgi:hypothetical protein
MKSLKFRKQRQNERGISLIIVLLLLLLVSAIGLGMLYMSNTETSINNNYRDSQSAFFAMRAGLEETRDRMRTNSPWPITPPAVLPGASNSILYLINPAGPSDTVNPLALSNAYFDDELCHEAFSGMILSNPGANIPCTTGAPSGFVSPYVTSVSPNTNTVSALKFKWVRLTLKENGTIANGIAAARVDAGQPASAPVCYQTLTNQEIALSSIPGGPFTSCSAAQQAGQDATPVYLATSLAVTPQGSRRMGQYDLASLNIGAPPIALGMDGPGAVFNPAASSNNFGVNGTDSGPSGYTHTGGTGSCTTTAPTVPAITTGDQPGVTNISSAIPTNRYNNYTGAGGTPSVVNGGASTFSGTWSSPASLDNMVAAIANVADVTYPQGSTPCGINGSGGTACTPVGGVAGTSSNPQITYVNGDFNLGSGSGAGVLVVTGTFSFSGGASWNGLILVVGQGIMTGGGGGNGQFNGSVFLAKTHSSTSPYPELTTLQSPQIGWNGGGTNFIQYNSCWAQVGNGKRYIPVATREEMY